MQRLQNGLNAVGVAAIAGRVSGTILTKVVADLAEKVGRTGSASPHQKLIVLDVPDDRVDELVMAWRRLGLVREAFALAAEPDGLHRNRVLQTVLRRDAVRAQTLVPDLESGWPTSTPNSTSRSPCIIGCPNSCARIRVADIGFRGQMVDDGGRSRASRCTWAAVSAWTAVSAGKLRQHRSGAASSATTSSGWSEFHRPARAR